MCHTSAVVLQIHGWMTSKIWVNVKCRCMRHPHMLVIICAKYWKNPSRTVCAVERIPKDVAYFSNFIINPWLNDLEDITQGQRSLCATHLLMLVIICACIIWKESIQNYRSNGRRIRDGRTNRRMDAWSEINIPPTTLLCGGYKYHTILVEAMTHTSFLSYKKEGTRRNNNVVYMVVLATYYKKTMILSYFS